MALSLLGPTMPTLALNLQSKVADLWFILPANGIGFILGSLVTRLIYKYVILIFILIFEV